MKDPAVRERLAAMQEAMKRPEVQTQMAEMQAAMQNQQLQARMAELKDDPDLQPMLADIQKNGMSALMKYWNDPKWLSKVGSKLGDVTAATAGARGAGVSMQAPPTGPAAAPEVNTLFDAAKYGDLEAAEDFLAIGKDVDMRDPEGRTPLFFAVAYNHVAIVEELLRADADVHAQDGKGNTPLHFAAGYARGALARRLVEAGANGAVENSGGNTPLELVTLEKRNPLNQDADTLAMLENAATAGLALLEEA
ncbi:hypothetical protein WJX81_003882 [Elliptochloris bilobata]|uniref:STI1/HOP DP domain-containing protein n=1 Tax=Elliptochloris bilobata TaxID=381761 RepID=A0AAW1QDW3_9CHLO